MLKEYDHDVIPIHPAIKVIDDTPVTPNLASVTKKVDTVSVYVNPAILGKFIDDIVALKPKRVIFNPGTESQEMEKILQDNTITVLNACTLVLLRTGQF